MQKKAALDKIIIIIIIIIMFYYNCRQTLQRTISNICHARQYTIIEYTQRIHAVQHGNVSSHTGALLLNAAQTETTIFFI